MSPSLFVFSGTARSNTAVDRRASGKTEAWLVGEKLGQNMGVSYNGGFPQQTHGLNPTKNDHFEV